MELPHFFFKLNAKFFFRKDFKLCSIQKRKENYIHDLNDVG